MKILCIAEEVGKTAPGIVYATILNELIKYFEVELICPDIVYGTLSTKVKILPCVKGYGDSRISTYSMRVFGTSIFDLLWAKKELAYLKEHSFDDVDIIITFMSMHHFKSVLLGEKLKSIIKKKWVIYSVDAIPSPLGWSKNNIIFRRYKKFITKRINKCDALFSSNEQMLQYQLSLVSEFNGFGGVVFTPIRDHQPLMLSSIQKNKPVFLYTGGIYGPRKKEQLIEGFRLLLREIPAAKLVFVGTGDSAFFGDARDLIDEESLILHPYVADLTPFYKDATALIDINAYFDNDVFLSSKIVNYLPLGKPIISITGNNSPSRNIFLNDPSIIHCKNNPSEIFESLMNSINIEVNMEFRNQYVEMFSASSIVAKFVKDLKCNVIG